MGLHSSSTPGTIPSAPTGVVTAGRPLIHASTIFPLIPAPNLSGASSTLASSIAPPTVGAKPSTRNPSFGACNDSIAAVGYAPYTRIVAVGSSRRMSGQTSAASHRAESTLGGW